MMLYIFNIINGENIGYIVLFQKCYKGTIKVRFILSRSISDLIDGKHNGYFYLLCVFAYKLINSKYKKKKHKLPFTNNSSQAKSNLEFAKSIHIHLCNVMIRMCVLQSC